MAGSPARRGSRRLSMPSLAGIKRRQTHYQIKAQRPRWVLHVQATFWRVLMGIGMLLHRMAPPRPPHPDFTFNIPSTVSSRPGTIMLHVYVPKDYEAQKRLHFEEGQRPARQMDTAGNSSQRSSSLHALGNSLRRRSIPTRRWGGYPVIINFHGGGFTLGTATDDARWCVTAVDECNAVVVSVDYRLAPEHPFPTAVEDGVDAVLWVHRHASELGIDTDKIALSGFSSGGNMAFSVPLRLYDHLTHFSRMDEDEQQRNFRDSAYSEPVWSESSSPTSPTQSSAHLLPQQKGESSAQSRSDEATSSSSPSRSSLSGPKDAKRPKSTVAFVEPPEAHGDVRIRCIVPWYPSLDYTRTREYRRATCKRADQELPALFTDLFDDSYLHPPKDVALSSPYLSPGVAPAGLLRAALPPDIVMHCCEWDMLLEEGEEFVERLRSTEIAKNVVYTMVPGVPHGWDKAPNPLKPTPGVREYYLGACRELRRILQAEPATPERVDDDGVVTAAPRSSRQIVN